MYYLDDDTGTHKTALNERVGNAKTCKLFSSLRQEDILLFFTEWMKNKRAMKVETEVCRPDKVLEYSKKLS